MVDSISGVQARSLFDVLDQLDTQQLGIAPPNLLLLGHGPRAVSRLFRAPLEHDDCRPGTGNLQSPFWLSLRRSEREQDVPAGHGGMKLPTYDDNVRGVPSVDLRHDGLAMVRRVSPYLPDLSFVYLTHGEQDGEEEESIPLDLHDDDTCSDLEDSSIPPSCTTFEQEVRPLSPTVVREESNFDLVFDQYLRSPSVSPPPLFDDSASKLSGVTSTEADLGQVLRVQSWLGSHLERNLAVPSPNVYQRSNQLHAKKT